MAIREIQNFINSNKPIGFYQILKKFKLSFGKYSIEVRLLRDDSN